MQRTVSEKHHICNVKAVNIRRYVLTKTAFANRTVFIMRKDISLAKWILLSAHYCVYLQHLWQLNSEQLQKNSILAYYIYAVRNLRNLLETLLLLHISSTCSFPSVHFVLYRTM